jgi:hypothetical protein
MKDEPKKDLEEEYLEEEYLTEELLMEESTVMDLAINGLLESNYFNTFEWSNNLYERIKNNKIYPLITSDDIFSNNLKPSLSYTLNDMNNYQSLGFRELELLESKFSKVGFRQFYPIPETYYFIDNPIDLFMNDILSGSIPPPEILLSIYKCFNLYFMAKGKFTLEDVFYGKLIKRAGSYAQRKFSKQMYAQFHWYVTRADYEPDFSLRDFAVKYVSNNDDDEYDDDPALKYFHEDNIHSFLKGYDRWKVRMAEDKIQKNAINERKNAIHERNVTESCLLALGYKNEEIIDLMNNHFNTKDCANTNLMNILKVLTDK